MNRSSRDREARAIAYIDGTTEVPKDLQALVDKYREYATVRAGCVSFPVGEDEDANALFDALVVLA